MGFNIEAIKKLCVDEIKKFDNGSKENIKSKLLREEYGLMPVQFGSRYQEGGLMVVGRAANGWRTFDKNVEGILVEEYVNKVYENPSAGIDCYWQGKIKYKYKGEERFYNYNRSPLWQLIHRYLEAKHGKELIKEWSSTIVDTNLYMIAPNEADRGYNPDGNLQDNTRAFMIKLFEETVKQFKPAEILFITGRDWLENFGSDLVDKIEPIGNNEGFVVGKGKLKNGTKFVVVNRPERRKGTRVEQAKAVKEAFDSVK